MMISEVDMRDMKEDGEEVAGPSPKTWTQQEITEWALSTFGMTPTPIVAMRMNKEVAELLTALALGDWKEARKEAADVGVMLMQVCELLGIDLMAAVSAKMEINAKRKWARTAAGDFQHVEEPKPSRSRCPECGEYDCDPEGVGHYRG